MTYIPAGTLLTFKVSHYDHLLAFTATADVALDSGALREEFLAEFPAETELFFDHAKFADWWVQV